mmetsp:Transcript_38362/g.53256  ORF Transcript_38362/g.53256 Transcript_38362/m.53256 type:complete len:161 (-) Transcript_38362:241-723(-)|eukprot:CAMPEP_0196571134 /NCGR_PEP_ID=MMETSP1081-20130531/1304_1 /TAXON_ID=36882 /ORGANISM="Pyramimonas amylifera, Strain CCMP720" /LENGTH=160 /DNA_ID=CAMNT_0041887937 /DNA_START=269 /DNA_END=751 /DNA_ORIENTATION=-
MGPVVLLPGAVEDSIKQADKTYLEKHHVKALMHQLLTDIVVQKPVDPIQYLVDVLSFDDPNDAKQDKFGLSIFRRRKLYDIFKQMDKNENGSVDFSEIQAHTSRYGGNALTKEEMEEIFKDFDSTGDRKITVEEFMQFFARAVSQMDNEEFDKMVGEMTD